MTAVGGKYTVYVVGEPCKEGSIVLCHVKNADGDVPDQKGIKDHVAKNLIWMTDELSVMYCIA